MIVLDVRQPLATSAAGNSDGMPGTVAAAWRTYCRPEVHSKLTDFCTELTGITQEDVAPAPTLPEAMRLADAWLRRRLVALAGAPPHSVRALLDDRGLPDPDVPEPAGGGPGSGAGGAGPAPTDDDAAAEPAAPAPLPAGSELPEFAFATDGPWDVKTFLHGECSRKGLLATHWPRDPPYWDAWVNLRSLFGDTLNAGRRVNISRMLSALRLRFEGNAHSGLDDSYNIARIARAMLARGVRLAANEGLSADVARQWTARYLSARSPEAAATSSPPAASFRASPAALSGGGAAGWSGESWASAGAAPVTEAGRGGGRRDKTTRRRLQQRLGRMGGPVRAAAAGAGDDPGTTLDHDAGSGGAESRRTSSGAERDDAGRRRGSSGAARRLDMEAAGAEPGRGRGRRRRGNRRKKGGADGPGE